MVYICGEWMGMVLCRQLPGICWYANPNVVVGVVLLDT